jgi:tRNA(fMet)-specific endonuclease VapC
MSIMKIPHRRSVRGFNGPAQYLLDTSVCLNIRRECPRSVLDRFNVLPSSSAAITVITYGELVYGVRRSPDPSNKTLILEELSALIPVLPITIDAAKTYGVIRLDLARAANSLATGISGLPLT